MKGGMVMSLITLCVVMLITANRLEHFMHGTSSATDHKTDHDGAPAFSTLSHTVSNLWHRFAGLFHGRRGASDDARTRPIKLTADNLDRYWVWMDDSQRLQFAAEDPGNGANEVLIPRGMTPPEFFAPAMDVASTRPHGPEAKTVKDRNPPATSDQHPPLDADALNTMTPAERRQLLHNGMRYLRRRFGG